MVGSIARNFSATLTAAAVIVAGFIGWRFLGTVEEAREAREKLADVTADFEELRETYDTAVARTAVTELLVRDGKLSVAIRTIDGREKIVPTPYDPSREIYVDYIVVNGRLWIRRVFDDRTAPTDGVIVDPTYSTIDWSAANVDHGKAVYRSLTDGRWIVTVTGDGSLGLRPLKQSAQVMLSEPPMVHEFEPTSR
jgi:hypothetical protein